MVCLCYTSILQQWGGLGQLLEYSHGKRKYVMKIDSDNDCTGRSRVRLKCDGTRWRTGGEVKGKLANGVGIQYSSHYLGTWCIQHYYRWCAHSRLPVVDWTDANADLTLKLLTTTIVAPPSNASKWQMGFNSAFKGLNGFVRFAERRNMVSARVNYKLCKL